MSNLLISKQNQLIPVNEDKNGDVVVSGRDLHEFLEIRTRYNDWFERMKTYGFTENTDFIAITQKRVTAQGNGTEYTDHAIKLDMAKELCMIQRNEKGKQARQYFITVEKAWNSPEMIMKRALEFANKKVIELQDKIQVDKPKVIFANSVTASKTSILVGELAKIIKQNGHDMGQNRLFQLLRDNGYLISRKGTDYNMPTQKSMELGLFEIKETSIPILMGI